MSETLDLNAVKIEIQRTILDDGLLEIMMGIYLILSVFYINNPSFVLHFLWLPIALVLIEVIRRRLIFPRFGYAKISLSTREILAIFGVIFIGVGTLAALIAWFAARFGHPIEGNWGEILSYALIIFSGIAFCFIGYRFRLPRWYMHGISIGVVFFLGKVLNAHVLVFLLGIWVTLVGMLVLRRFLGHFPMGPKHALDHRIQTEDGDMPEAHNAS